MNYPSLPGQAFAPEKVHLPVVIDYPVSMPIE